MSKKAKTPKLERQDEAVILKAYNGDRKKNLQEIAKEFREMLDGVPLAMKERRRFQGYCEQLEIIADEDEWEGSVYDDPGYNVALYRKAQREKEKLV